MVKERSSFITTLKTVSAIFIFVLPILAILYFLWMRYRIPLIFYVEDYRELSYLGILVVLASYAIAIVSLMFTWNSVKNLKISGIERFGIALCAITIPCYCLSSSLILYLPTIIDQVNVGKEAYYLTGELEYLDSHVFHRLYKCDKMRIRCEMTPFWEGGGASFRPLHLMIDKSSNKNEVDVTYTFGDGTTKLIYTYGAPNRYYDEPAQLGDRLFYLAYYYDGNPQTPNVYMLYQCKLDNTSCKRLPFEYQGFWAPSKLGIEANTSEIKLYFQDDWDWNKSEYKKKILIYAYGEHPRCYIEGCEIIEK